MPVASSALPLLPTLVPAILAAAQTAVQGLPHSSAGNAEVEASSSGCPLCWLHPVGALCCLLMVVIHPYLSCGDIAWFWS